MGAGVVGLQAATGGEPDGVVPIDDFGRVAVADDFKETGFAVFEFLFVKDGGTGVAFFGDGPLVNAVADVVPVESFVDGAEGAEFVEDVFGGSVFEAWSAEAFGDFGNDPPIGFGIAVTRNGGAEALDAAFGVGLDAVGFAPGGGGEDDVGHLGGLGEEDVDHYEVVESFEGLFAVVLIGVGDDGVFAVDEHGVDAVFFRSAEVEGGDLGHGIAKIQVGLLVEFLEFFVELGIDDGLEAGVVVGDRPTVARALDVVLATHRVDAGALLAEVAGEEGEVAERLDVINAADVLGDAEGVVDGSELGRAIPEGGLFDIVGGDFANFGSPGGREFPEVGFEGFVVGAAIGDEFGVGESFPHDDVGHGEEEGDIGSDANGKVEMGELGEAGSARVGDDELGSFGEGFFEAGGGDGVALGHVGADGEDGIGLVHVLERIGHCASSDLSGQTGHGGSVSGSTAVIDMMRPEAGPNELLHGVSGFVRGPARGNSENTMSSVLRAGVGEAFGGGGEGGVPVDFLEGTIGLLHEGFLEAVLVLDKVVGELAFDAEGSLVGGAIHGGLGSDDLIALGHEVDGAADGAVGADGAGFLDGLGEGLGAEGLFIGEGTGGTGLNALAAEGAVGVAEVVVKLGGDLSVETPVGDGDGIIAFLFGANSHATVARDALFVVAEDEGVGVLKIGGAGFGTLKATAAGSVFVNEGGEFLGGEAAKGIDIDLAVFGSDHFEERLAHLLDVGWRGFDDHAVVGPGGARGDGVADAFDLDDAETAAAEGVEPVIVTEGGDVFLETFGNLIDRFALSESGLLAIDGDGKRCRDGGIGVVDHVGSKLVFRRSFGSTGLYENGSSVPSNE